MPDYRRYFVSGGTYFFTLVTHRRYPWFADPANIQRLRHAAASVRQESPFRFLAGVVLHNHMHFLWTLPPGDADFSSRIGRMKVRFSRSLGRRARDGSEQPASRRKHHECDIWQRRFWEHSIDNEEELLAYLDYIHFNPVKHGLAPCSHAWEASSFHGWVAAGFYERSWGCCCQGLPRLPQQFAAIEQSAGEPPDE
jgi:putative transposase